MGGCKTKTIETDLGTFRHNQTDPGIIQGYSGIFRTLYYHDIFKSVVYPEPCQIKNQRHLQNTGIFKIRGIFRTLPNIYNEEFCENS